MHICPCPHCFHPVGWVAVNNKFSVTVTSRYNPKFGTVCLRAAGPLLPCKPPSVADSSPPFTSLWPGRLFALELVHSLPYPSLALLPMPTITEDYEVLLRFSNDTHDCATVQLSRDYGRNTGAIVLFHPGEVVTLILEAGSTYRYVLKTRSKVASVSARTWRDVQCAVSQLFASAGSQSQAGSMTAVTGVTVDRIWRDYRFSMWDDP